MTLEPLALDGGAGVVLAGRISFLRHGAACASRSATHDFRGIPSREHDASRTRRANIRLDNRHTT